MDNPGESLFQTGEINLNKSRTEEEQEDLEDQKRRNEELQNLLLTKLDDFNYDESTVNSSIVSAISCNNDNENKYLQANSQQEQLQILCEVRLRELQALREQYNKDTEKLNKEIDSFKKKLLLSEAELEQIKVSYKNSDNLLVEKTGTIKELSNVLESKEQQIQEYRKTIEDLRLEISTYKTTINDLHLQYQSDRHPFSKSNKQFTSEEYKNANKEHITRLEVLLEEKTKNAKLLEKENTALKEELNKLIVSNNEGVNSIQVLTRNFESAQKQSMELIDVLEALTNENKHLQERVANVYQNSPGSGRLSDKTNLIQQLDKLKKMLVDKSVHMDTLNVKLRNYDENMIELLEYRQLKSDVYKKEFQQCENEDHTKNLILMQNDLQNYRRIIEDKNQQILNLNSTNKDLLAKMEETLYQTRNDINNLSNKYSMPQLEKMAEDLKAAEDQIASLEEKLKSAEQKMLSMDHQECNKEKELKNELEKLKLLTEKDRNNFENEIKKLNHELEVSLVEINNLKKISEELVNENVKLKSYMKQNGSLKAQYTDLELELKNTLNKLKEKEEMVKGLKETAALLKEEIKSKDQNIESVLNEIKVKEDLINNLQQTVSNIVEELESVKNAKESEEAKVETTECMKCRCVEEVEKTATPEIEKKKELDAELKELEEQNLERIKEADKISIEFKLREEIQEEYFKKLEEIENKYQKVYAASKNLCKEQADKLKTQEIKFREHFATILGECTKKMKEYEQDREDLIKEFRDLQSQFDEYKIITKNKERNFKKVLEEFQLNSKQEAEKWKLWSQRLVNSCLKLESTNKKTRDNVLFKMGTYDTEVAVVEKSFEKNKKMLTNGT